MQLKDKVVFITGGAQGIGRAVAEAVLKKDAKVCLVDVKTEQGEQTAKELQSTYGKDNVLFVRCDVSDSALLEDAFKNAISRFGHIDIVCNNAGIMDERIWEKQIDINFNGVVRGTMMAINHMRKDKGGRGGVIINTSSVGGLNPGYWCPVYCATKSAVHHFTSSWSQNPEIKASKIRFASICPGGVRTAILNLTETQVIDRDNLLQTLETAEFCTVQQVVDGFLMAMEDDRINGSLIVIDAKKGVVFMKQKFVIRASL